MLSLILDTVLSGFISHFPVIQCETYVSITVGGVCCLYDVECTSKSRTRTCMPAAGSFNIGVMSLWCFIMSNTIKSKATTPVTNHRNTFGPNYPSNKPTDHMTKKPTKQLITEKRAQAPVQKIFFIMRKNTESRQLLLAKKTT